MRRRLGVGLVGIAVALGLALTTVGCGNRGAPAGKPGETPDAAQSAGEGTEAYLKSAQDALKRQDVEAATIELQGAQSLLQQALVKQRQAELEHPSDLPSDPLVTAADQHLKTAEALKAKENWDAAAAHYQTVTSLLQVASDREQRKISAQESAFNKKYAEARNAVQQWYEKELKKELSAEEKSQVLEEYQSKMSAVTTEWEPRQKEHTAKMQELRKAADERRAELTRKRCDTFRAIAEIYKSKGEEQQAQYYETMAYQELARVLDNAGDREAAEAEYRKWVKARPDDVSARMSLARCLEQQEKLDEAAEQYRTVLKKSPDDTYTRFQLAGLLGRQEKWDDALAQWKTLINANRDRLAEIKGEDEMSKRNRQSIKSQIGSNYWQMAGVCRQAGKTDEAKAAYKKAVEMNPGLEASVPEGFK